MTSPDASVWAARFESLQPKLLVTSSHGFERGFEMPFGRGYILAKGGDLIALDSAKVKTAKELEKISRTDSPKVWLAVEQLSRPAISRDRMR